MSLRALYSKTDQSKWPKLNHRENVKNINIIWDNIKVKYTCNWSLWRMKEGTKAKGTSREKAQKFSITAKMASITRSLQNARKDKYKSNHN